MNYQEFVGARKRLDAERNGLILEADTLLAKDDFSEEDAAAVDALKGHIDRTKARLALLDTQIEEALSAPPTRDFSQATEEDNVGDLERGRQTSAITTSPAHGGKGAYASIGEQAMDVYRANALGDSAARERLVNSAAHALREQGIQAAASGQNIAVDSDGGHLVQTDFSTAIWQRMTAGGAILSRVTPLPLNPGANSIELPGVDETSRATGSRWGGITGYWVEEGGTVTGSKQGYYRVPLKLKKVAAITYATEEMLAHVSMMELLLTQGMADELRFLVEDAIFEGDGSGKPAGFTNAAAAISVAKETGQAAATVTHDNLQKMWARFHAASRGNGIWLINQDVEPALDDLSKTIGTDGVEPNYVSYGPDGVLRIKGRPVIAVEYASTVGTVGDIVLVDLTQYAMIMTGIQQATSIHFKFDTDEQAFRSTLRVDGALRWKSALTPFKGSNTQSPVVTLASRA